MDPELPKELPPDAIETLPPADVPRDSPPRAEIAPPEPYNADPPEMLMSPPSPSTPVESPASTVTDPPDEPLPTESDNEPERPPTELPLEMSTEPLSPWLVQPELNETSPDAAEDGLDTTRTEPDRTWSLDPDDIRMSPP
jgi:hypothetical protein